MVPPAEANPLDHWQRPRWVPPSDAQVVAVKYEKWWHLEPPRETPEISC